MVGELRDSQYSKGIRNYKDVLKDLIPEEVLKLIPRSYDIVGDTALINLPKELMGYGREVGEAILRVNKNVKSVYAVGATSGDFRVRELTHLAGEDKTTTIHKEYGIRIYVDLKSAYYNPSLSEERRRIAEKVLEGDSVLDLFAGVGPFTLHIACTKKASILANDLNPYAVECLRKSLGLNIKSLKGIVNVVNGDASEVLNALRKNTFNKAILNLPHRSIQYLPKTYEVLKDGGTIYTYVVASNEEEATKEVENALTEVKYVIREKIKVLDYAPHKYIFRVEVIKT
ncbi:MAG: class I SAM-dependent methyltransferase family protein [Sulfolobales archaeon]